MDNKNMVQDEVCRVVKWIRSEIQVEEIVVLGVRTVVTSCDYTHYAGAIFGAPVPLAGCSAARQFVLALLALGTRAHFYYLLIVDGPVKSMCPV